MRRGTEGAILGALALGLSGCAGWAPGDRATDVAVIEDEHELARVAARSLWAVYPEAPEYKKELEASRISGAAVAVNDDRLLVACAALDDEGRVGVARHNKYHIGVAAPQPNQGEGCLVDVEPTDVNLPAGYRTVDDLEAGERVLALFSDDPANATAVGGRIVRLDDGSKDVAVILPAEVRSAVLFDERGMLVGVMTAGGELASLEPAPGVALARAEIQETPTLIRRRDDDDANERRFAVAIAPDRDSDEEPGGSAPGAPDAATAAIAPAAGPEDADDDDGSLPENWSRDESRSVSGGVSESSLSSEEREAVDGARDIGHAARDAARDLGNAAREAARGASGGASTGGGNASSSGGASASADGGSASAGSSAGGRSSSSSGGASARSSSSSGGVSSSSSAGGFGR